MLVLLDRDWEGGVEADPPDKNFSHQSGGHLQPVGVKPAQPHSRQIERWLRRRRVVLPARCNWTGRPPLTTAEVYDSWRKGM